MIWFLIPALIWLGLLCLPFQSWRVRERLDAESNTGDLSGELGDELSDISALIPARDEAGAIGATIAALKQQGRNLAIIVIDDQSSDATAAIATAAGARVVAGQPLPAGWAGKMWALEQGRVHARRKFTLLLDADIALQPRLIATLRGKMRREGVQLVSLMCAPRMRGWWEKLLLPAFVYFFKLIYPFRLANDPAAKVAAAAGGCILLETRALDAIGGFAALKDELIDDCALARRIKRAGFRTWLGLTLSAHSLRRYESLTAIWNMVARSAYTQLGYSPLLLIAVALIFAAAFWAPLAMLLIPEARGLAAVALIAMAASYLPVLGFYRLSPAWALALPFIATLYLAMTMSSALRYHAGERSRWKGRLYTTTRARRARTA